ncbi:MAG: N-acetyl-gamma-glutamyl-phosphate reductase [Rhodothermales bacterium]
MISVAVLHAAGYVGRSLMEVILAHPDLDLVTATSRSFTGQPISDAHPTLAGRTNLKFVSSLEEGAWPDLVFVAAGHGQGATAVGNLRDAGFDGLVVDMSADFRLPDAQTYVQRYGTKHPRPDLLAGAWYGMPEITGPPPAGTTLIANPGCFATAISLALYPFSGDDAPTIDVFSVTAMTGASGSGALPKPTTHFPDREGNMRAYKVFSHQHEAEIDRMAPGVSYRFVPVSGPWTAGIWGTAQATLPAGVDEAAITRLFESCYAEHALIRLWPGKLPELRWSVGSPFTDLGWVIQQDRLVVGFGIDNLMKGAATQAVQNANLALGWENTHGLIP